MTTTVTAVTVVLMMWASQVVCIFNVNNTQRAFVLIDRFEKEVLPEMKALTEVTWAFFTGRGTTEEDMHKATRKMMDVRGKYQESVAYFMQREQRVRTDVRRRMKMAETGFMDPGDAIHLHAALSNMSRYYEGGRVCRNLPVDICQTIPGGIIRGFAEEKDPHMLEEMWRGWYSDMGAGLTRNFNLSVPGLNQAARSIGWRDYGEEMMKTYERFLTPSDIVRLYMDVEALYKLLHSYVRRRLNKRFPNEVISMDGALPVTLLGDLFGRFWSSLYGDMMLYPESPGANITAYMQQVSKNYTWIYKWAEERFLSMGLEPLPDEFFEKSVLVDTDEGREMGCQPSAWDMYDDERKDFRVFMCTEVAEEHLQAVIHLMGHIQYYQHFAHQPFLYRDGANEGFQEALGNLFMLAFTNPTHFYKHGFYDVKIKEKLTKEIQMNYLLHVGLALLPTLPYFLSLDVWRWKVYGGIYAEHEWNCEYWKLRKHFSGVLPTVPRMADAMDMLPNYQLSHTQTATQHFTAIFMMFQILESLCEEEGHDGPPHTCDLYGGKKAGKRLADAMTLGRSKPWPFVYRILTGDSEIRSEPLRRYFQPLYDWLREDGLKAGVNGIIGWGDPISTFKFPGGSSRLVANQWWQVSLLTLLYLAVTKLIQP